MFLGFLKKYNFSATSKVLYAVHSNKSVAMRILHQIALFSALLITDVIDFF